MIGGWRSDQHPLFCAPQGMCFGNNGSMLERTLGDKSKAAASTPDRGWLDLKQIATVEVTSEDSRFPSILFSGRQIRIIFAGNGPLACQTDAVRRPREWMWWPGPDALAARSLGCHLVPTARPRAGPE
jgi:hypothetical protein